MIKIKMMTNQTLKLREMVQNKGFVATLIRNVVFAMAVSSICFGKEKRSDLVNFGYSASAGVIGSVLTQPIDYVKTQQQRSSNSGSIFRILIDTYREAPKKLFIGGFNRSLLRFFSIGIGFVAYDKLYKLFCE